MYTQHNNTNSHTHARTHARTHAHTRTRTSQSPLGHSNTHYTVNDQYSQQQQIDTDMPSFFRQNILKESLDEQEGFEMKFELRQCW